MKKSLSTRIHYIWILLQYLGKDKKKIQIFYKFILTSKDFELLETLNCFEDNAYLVQTSHELRIRFWIQKPYRIKIKRIFFDLQNFISPLEFYGLSGCPSPWERAPSHRLLRCCRQLVKFLQLKERGFLLFYMMLMRGRIVLSWWLDYFYDN